MTVSTLEPPKVAAAHSHVRVKSPESQFERYDTIDTPRIVVIGFISAILTFIAILAAQALFFAADHAEVERKVSAAIPSPLTDGLTQQQNKLAGYGWVDPAKGVVNIPVNDAMKLVLEEQQKVQKPAGEAQ